MQNARSLRRSLLLSISLCAALAAPGLVPTPAKAGALLGPPSGAYGAYLAGHFAAQQGDRDFAAKQLLRAAEADPANVDLRKQTFVACLLGGRPEALALARRLPHDLAAQFLIADSDAAAGRWDDAARGYRALAHAASAAQMVQPLLVAWAEQGAGHTDAALATLQPLLEGQRYRAVYALHAGLIADLGGRAADAAHFYRIAQQAFGGTNLRLAQVLASWQARQGDKQAADATLGALARSDRALGLVVPALEAHMAARPVASATDGIAEAYLALAASLRPQTSADFAQLLLRLALDLRPSLTTARLLLADTLQRDGQPDQALAALAAVADSDPLHGLVALRRAGLEQAMGDKAEAMRDLDALAREYPASPEPLIEIGDALRTQSRFADAVDAYSKAIARIGTPTSADWPVYYARAIAYDRAHQWGSAEADLKKALRLSPDQPYVLNYLGYSWAEQGRNLEGARRLIDKAAQLKPNDGAILDSMGWVLMRLGNTAEAIGWLERAVEVNSEDATINGHLGDAYWAAGRKLQAEFQWRRALTLNPAPADAAKLEAKLRDSTAPAIKPATATTQVQ